MLKDKRGATTWLWILVGIAVLITVMSFFLGDITNAISNVSVSGATKISEFYTGNNFIFSYVTKGADYIIGAVPENILDSSNKFSGLIIVIALWILIFLMFGDILANFGGFSKEISWAVAFLLVVIGANLKMVTAIAAVLTAIFLPLGVFAVYAGLFSAFVAFFVVEWGIQSMMPWVMRRKGAQEAARAQHNTGTILDAIQHYKKVGKELGTP